MIDVEMSDDIRKYETKTKGMFTTRQVVCIVIGLAVALPIGLLLPFKDFWNKILAIVFIALPFWFCGHKVNGVNLEVLALRFIYLKYLTPAKRRVIQKNWFHESMNEYNRYLEKIKILKLNKSQRSEYEKMNKKGNIKYSIRKEYKVYK